MGGEIDDDDSRREYRAFEQWRDGIYYVVGYIQVLATFTQMLAHRRCIRTQQALLDS